MIKAPLRATPKNGPVQVARSAFASESMIELRGVVKRFSNAAGEFTVLKGVDLTINRGEFVSIVGNKCIPDLPDSRVPMILVYRKGEIKQQLVAWGADRERRIEGNESFDFSMLVAPDIEPLPY